MAQEITYTDFEQLQQPEMSQLELTFEGLAQQKTWNEQFQAISQLRAFVKFYPDDQSVLQLIEQHNQKIKDLANDQRSHVSKATLIFLKEVCKNEKYSTMIAEQFLEILLKKSINDKKFIKEQAESALSNLTKIFKSVQFVRNLASIIQTQQKNINICNRATQMLEEMVKSLPSPILNNFIDNEEQLKQLFSLSEGRSEKLIKGLFKYIKQNYLQFVSEQKVSENERQDSEVLYKEHQAFKTLTEEQKSCIFNIDKKRKQAQQSLESVKKMKKEESKKLCEQSVVIKVKNTIEDQQAGENILQEENSQNKIIQEKSPQPEKEREEEINKLLKSSKSQQKEECLQQEKSTDIQVS